MPTRQERQLEEEMQQLEALVFGNPDSEEPFVKEDPQEEPATEASTEEDVSMETTDETEESAPEESGVITSEEDHQEPTEEEPKKERTNWKKRYTNYKAHADSTIYQLRQDKVRLEEEVVTLTEKVDVLSKTVAEATANESLPPDLLSQEERDLLGDETVSAMEKVQKAMNERMLKPLQDQLDRERELRKKAEENARKDLKETNSRQFLAKLEGLVPDYAEINVNPSFINYMEEADIDSGFTRKHLFKQAERLGDVGRVAQFFKEFKRVTNKPTEKLERKVTPKKSAGSQAQSGSKGIEWTSEGINAFYDDCIRGAYDGRETERKELEASIDKAIASGEVRV